MEVLWSQMKHQVAACDAPLFNYAVKRADPRDLMVVFYKYASVEHDGERFMTPSDLIRDFLQMDAGCFNPATLRLLSGVVDETKDGLISFPEFQAFEAMLCTPDAKFKLLFRLFDLDGKGSVTLDEFQHLLETMTTYEKIPFNFDSPFIKNYFGKERKLQLSYNEFTQFIQEFQREYLRQAFFKKPVKEGSISSLHFSDIMKKLFPHMLSGFVLENLSSVATESAGRRVTFTYCVAFKNLLENLTTMEQIIRDITANDKFLQVTKEEVLQEISSHPQVSPLQVEILFQLCNLGHPSIGKISLVDVHKLKPKHNPLTVFSKIAEIKTFGPSEEPEPEKQSIGMQVLESLYKFSLGSVAGAAGATAVYPIDLVKTRMQNQRSVLAGEIMYKNSFDCFAKTLRNEGILGLYRGLLPQLVGVSPEKAIKLTTNDFCRAKLKDKEGEISLLAEVISGGAGGAAQVMFTNPIEIVKIRMQIAGETGVRPSAIATAAELGFFGLYKGARACFLRDIPFSAIYFPCYAHLKTKFADRDGYNKAPSLLAAATLAGVPAAYLVTPADVIKTRLQVKARRGQQTYRGVIDCLRKVWAEEGGKAFWKGGPARIFRSSPQFGVTLLTYELLQRLFYLDFGGGKVTTELAPQNPEVSRHPDHIGGLRLAVATFSSVETKFGLFLPKFNSPPGKVVSKPPPPPASPVSLGTTESLTQS